MSKRKNTYPEKKKIMCVFCKRLIRLTPSTHDDHIRGHINERPFTCTICKKRFSSMTTLRAHYQSHSEDRPFECLFCKQRYKTNASLISHIYRHTGEKPYDCRFPKCEMTFVCKSSLNNHLRSHKGERNHECKICKKKFATTTGLAGHQRQHTGDKPFECDICGQKFRDKANVKVHRRRHTGEKPYKCDICSRSFCHLSHMKRHKLTHSDLPGQFQCDLCDRVFKQECSLKYHKETFDHEKFYCAVCGAVFDGARKLTVHILIHEKKKLYHCDMCDEVFVYQCRLNDHKKLHMDGKIPCNKSALIRGREFAETYQYTTYDCNICDKKFEKIGDLRLHKMKHRGKELFKCDECGKQFAWLCRLKEHMEKSHKIF